jgi:hypothetical protein
LRYISLMLIFALVACVEAHSQCQEDSTILRAPGALLAKRDLLSIHCGKGDFTIDAVGILRRKYSWHGGIHTVLLQEMSHKRGSEPTEVYNAQWYPHLFGFTGNVVETTGMAHGLSSESTINFANEKMALDWLFIEPAGIPYVWRKDGLCAWCDKQEHFVAVNVYQIYINGSKPSKLPGGDAESIKLVGINTPNKTTAAISEQDITEKFDRYLKQHLSKPTPTARDLVNAAHCQVVIGDSYAALATLERAEQLDRNVDGLERVRAKALRRKTIEQEEH